MEIDGILNLAKPLGLSSGQALDRVRRILGQRKSGHAGSLDPLATGVLVICLGRGTKLVERFMDQPKVYRTSATLDVTSISFDLERETTPVAVNESPTRARVEEVLCGFEGTPLQTPPAMSAIKIAGRSAYKLARAGHAPQLAARPVRIYWIRLQRYEWPQIEFDVACGRGTYIRALIRDIGVQLQTGGCLTGLTRLAVGPLSVDESWSLERLAQAPDPTAAVIPFAQAEILLANPLPPPRPT